MGKAGSTGSGLVCIISGLWVWAALVEYLTWVIRTGAGESPTAGRRWALD